MSSTPVPFIAALLGLSIAAPLPACQVPVFRFALERWAAADYRAAVVAGAGGLMPVEQAAAEALKKAAASANVAVETTAAAPAASQGATLELRFPDERGTPRHEQAIWSVPLTQDSVRNLIDSPVRQELRQRLLAGQSAVWLLVESGDGAKDEAAAAALTEALGKAQESLKLPEGVMTPAEAQEQGTVRSAAPGTGAQAAPATADVLTSDLPLKIEFSVLRVRRADPKEQALLSMLMHLEDDLGEFVTEPMVFPVFGRGRALEPLIGRGIHADNVLEHATYLCGACSCEVKEQNPGMDLLLAANWEPVAAPPPEVVQTLPVAQPPPTSGKPRQNQLMMAGASMLALSLGVWMLRRKPVRA